MEQPMRNKMCLKCRTWRFPAQFIKNSREMKTCESCRCRDMRYKEKNREVLNEKQKQNYIKRKEIVYFTQLLEATEQIKIQ